MVSNILRQWQQKLSVMLLKSTSSPISLLANSGKKTLILIPLLLLLVISFNSLYTSKPTPDPWLNIKPPQVPGPPSDISKWGERGTRVRELAEWADLLSQYPTGNNTEHKAAFEAALIQQFPYLEHALDSIYTPWSTSQKHPAASTSPDDHGFVICAGSGNYQLAAHLIRSLRRVHGSTAPFEIAYAGDDDLKPKHRQFLSDLESDITFIDLLQRFPAAKKDLAGSGWAMKPFSLLASAHPRAILMDADALFLASPDNLFREHPALSKTGTLFFHDRAAVGGDGARLDWVKAAIETTGRNASTYLEKESLFYSGAAWYEADSGVVALDRTNPRVLLGLMFATWMNTKQVRDEITYSVFYGDKETFWLAMELSGFDYSFQPWYAGTMGTVTKENGETPNLENNKVEICGKHMLHLDYTGENPFWFNGGIYEDKGKPQDGFAKMTHYWVGNTSSIRLTQPSWYWGDGNVACLKELGVKELSESTQRAVLRVQEEGKIVDELIKALG